MVEFIIINIILRVFEAIPKPNALFLELNEK